jgi:hypothetical protein
LSGAGRQGFRFGLARVSWRGIVFRMYSFAFLIIGSALGFSLCQGRAQSPLPPGELPILAWIGPPSDQTTPERYRELADAGFNTSFSGFPDAQAMERALEVARGAGVKLMISCPELRSDPESTVRRFKNHPAVAGYYLRDEPSAADFKELGDWVRRIRAIDDALPCYLNLFPTYASPEQLGTATYREHVDRFLKEVPVQVVSFDHYPIVGDRLRADWYENLEIIAEASKSAGKPFWAFALAVAHNPYPVATVDGLRLQVFSNLAYGARAIQYFTYWTPVSTQWNFHRAPIESDGTRTEVYDRVRQVNRELRVVAPVFLGSEVVEVAHLGDPLPRGTRHYQPIAPVRSLDTGGKGAVVSRLRSSAYEYLVVVSRELRAPMELTAQFAGSQVEVFEPQGQWRALDSTAGAGQALETACRSTVTPGDIRLFRWNR